MSHKVLSRLFLEWLLVLLAVFGALFCLLTAFSLPVPLDLWGLVFFATVLDCAAMGYKKAGRITALVLLAGMLLFTFLLRRELAESFRNLWGLIGSRYALGYDRVLDYLPRGTFEPEATEHAILAIALWEAYLVSLSVRQWKRTFPAALALLVCIAPCFILLDTPPDLPPLLLVVLSVMTQAFSQSVRRRATGEERRALCLAALLSAALLALVLAIFPQKGFKPPITWDELNQEMSKWSQAQNNRGNVNAGLSGNPDTVELRTLGALPNHPSTALYVQSTVAGSYYLRGSSYLGFDGDTWSRGELRNWGDSALFPYLQPDVGETLSLETVNREALYYTVYQTTALPEGSHAAGDAYVRNDSGETVYSLRFLTNTAPHSPDKDYDAWVMQNCLSLPDEARDGVLDWWERNGSGVEADWTAPASDLTSIAGEPKYRLTLDSSGNVVVVMDYGGWKNEIAYSAEDFHVLANNEPHFSKALADYAQAVANRVSKCAVYSRNPERVPDGEDFCTWFLNDARSGYCVHFASACTALLRSLGIPARYVSGYICTLKANDRTQVTNLQAHAWVEIWCGGRWLPIEPTPDDATEFTGTTYTPSGNQPLQDPDATDIYPSEYQRPPMVETDPLYSEETRFRPSRPDNETTEARDPDQSGSGKSASNLTPVWILLGVAGTLALILGRRALALRLWEKHLAKAGPNEKACLLYRRCVQLNKLSGGLLPEDAVALANRAGFSQHELTPEELDYLRQLLTRQGQRLALVSFWKNLYAKFILAIV